MTTVKIPELDSVYPAYRDARQRCEQLEEERERLTKEATDDIQKGRMHKDGLNRRGTGLMVELADAQLAIKAAKAEAAEAAKAQLLRNKAYQKLVLDTVAALAERLEPFVAYTLVVRDAGRQGIRLRGLTPAVEAEITGAVEWAKDMLRAGLLDEASLPPALRELAGLKNEK